MIYLKKCKGVVIVLLLCFIMSGCGTNSETQSTASPITETASPQTELPSTEIPDINTTTPGAVDTTKEPSNMDVTEKPAVDKSKELPIYSINDETQESEDAIALIPEGTKITAKLIVNEVVKAFSEHSIEIGIHSVKREKSSVYVSFKKGTAPSTSVGSGVEGAILDGIAKSLIDNLDYCNKVIYRIENESYASGHFEFDYDQAYLWQ